MIDNTIVDLVVGHVQTIFSNTAVVRLASGVLERQPHNWQLQALRTVR